MRLRVSSGFSDDDDVVVTQYRTVTAEDGRTQQPKEDDSGVSPFIDENRSDVRPVAEQDHDHENLEPNKLLECEIYGDKINKIKLKCRIDTKKELDYFKAGGILNFVLNEIISKAA